ncbi:hypothetical protein [Nocardioides marmoraquaticus]
MRLRTLVVLVVLVVAAGVGVATWRGQVQIPALAGCTTELDGVTVRLSVEQAQNASLIAAIGIQRGLPARAVSIALATAYQESKIRNIDYGDRDSLGLFQQRPSQGWGTEEQVQDEFYATNAFYEALEQVDGYEQMRITEAAQTVQRSGFPEAYEDHAEDARALASVLTGYSPGGRFSCTVGEPGSPDREGFASLVDTAFGARVERDAEGGGPVTVTVGRGDAGNRLGWAAGQFAVAQAERYGVADVTVGDRTWTAGSDSRDGWTRADDPAPDDRVRIGFDG